MLGRDFRMGVKMLKLHPLGFELIQPGSSSLLNRPQWAPAGSADVKE
jgi:hypothetical protein